MGERPVTPETVKLLEENTGCNLFDTGRGNFFLDTSPKEGAVILQGEE